MAALNQRVAAIIDSGRHELVLNVNAHGLNLAYTRPWLRDLLNSAEIVFCDGAGVILAAKILGHRIPERITYVEWVWPLSEMCLERGYSMYLLGGEPGVAEASAELLRKRNPGIEIPGSEHGYFDKTPGGSENQMVIGRINENWSEIDARVALTSGGMFRLLSGNLRRGPSWMTDHGLEWLFRLVIEPRRVWRRS